MRREFEIEVFVIFLSKFVAVIFVFSAVIRLYKSLARKPWLNGLPRASRLLNISRSIAPEAAT